MLFPSAVPQQVARSSIVLSVLLIVCGFLAILLPIETSFGAVIVIAWLLMIGAFVQFVHAFRCTGIGHILWRAAVAIVYFVTGLYLRLNLGLGLAALTLALIVFFVSQGLIDIFAYLSTRRSGLSGWFLLDGVITLILGFMIWRHWPGSSMWVIGTLVGINMLVTGITRLMLTIALRNKMTVVRLAA